MIERATELAAAGIVLLYVTARARNEPRPIGFFCWLACLSATSWLAEESCIRLYGFYHYSEEWSVLLGHVPVLVALIWPAIIHSAWTLARQFSLKRSRVSIFAAGIVLTDAALIEPIASAAGLWTWHRPGLFQVPLIGIGGWAVFALFSVLLSERARHGGNGPGYRSWWSLPIAVLAIHPVLIMLWWAGLRWITTPIHPGFGTLSAWVISIVLVVRIWRNRTGERIDKESLMLRTPGAIFFFALLVLGTEHSLWLVAYGVAFTLPYCSMLGQQYRLIPRKDSHV